MTLRLAGGRRATRTLFLAAAFALLRGEGDARATVSTLVPPVRSR